MPVVCIWQSAAWSGSSTSLWRLPSLMSALGLDPVELITIQQPLMCCQPLVLIMSAMPCASCEFHQANLAFKAHECVACTWDMGRVLEDTGSHACLFHLDTGGTGLQTSKCDVPCMVGLHDNADQWLGSQFWRIFIFPGMFGPRM